MSFARGFSPSRPHGHCTSQAIRILTLAAYLLHFLYAYLEVPSHTHDHIPMISCPDARLSVDQVRCV